MTEPTQKVINHLQTVQVQCNLTDIEMLSILGEVLHIWLDKLSQDNRVRIPPGPGGKGGVG